MNRNARLALVALLLVAADKTARTDPDRIRGAWELVSSESEGSTVPPAG
jgi:hypothetical protein